MKNRILILSIVALTAFSNTLFANHNHSDLKINTTVSTVNWVGKKVTGQHSGAIAIKEGTLNLHDGNLSGGKIIMDMANITCTDLEGKMNGKLVGHLNSADFFDVANHATAVLDIKGVRVIENNNKNVEYGR